MQINQPIKYLIILSSIMLSACATGPTSTATTQPESGKGTEKPATSDNQSDRLSRDLIYNTLTSEIAAQRGQTDLAFEHALQAARESRDDSTAERATSLALQANKPDAAMTAAKLWIDISPKSLKAHQIAAILYIRKKRLGDAIQHLQQVVEIANDGEHAGYLQAAAIAEKSGTPGQALIIMQQLVEEGSTNPKALYALAMTANQAKQHDLALDYVNRSLSFSPQSAQSLVLKTHTLIALDKQSEAMAFLKQAVDDSPDNILLGKSYARILLELDQPEAALDTFKRLNELAPDDSDIIFSLGIIHMQLEQFERAKSYLVKLVDNRNKRNEANYYLGMVAEEESELEKALAWYSQVKGKNRADAQVRIARIQAEQGNLDQARETLQRLRINQPQNQVKFYIIEAEFLRKALQFEDAHQVYSTALEFFHDNIDLLYARGLNAADLKRVDLLENDIRKILATQPENADALNVLGYTLADQTDRLQEAKQYIQQALSLKPDSPAILDSMGWVEYRLGNNESALEFLNKAAELSPDAEIAAHLGEVLWHLGQREDALKVWKDANQREPNNRYVNPVMSRLGADN